VRRVCSYVQTAIYYSKLSEICQAFFEKRYNKKYFDFFVKEDYNIVAFRGLSAVSVLALSVTPYGVRQIVNQVQQPERTLQQVFSNQDIF